MKDYQHIVNIDRDGFEKWNKSISIRRRSEIMLECFLDQDRIQTRNILVVQFEAKIGSCYTVIPGFVKTWKREQERGTYISEVEPVENSDIEMDIARQLINEGYPEPVYFWTHPSE